MSLAIAIAGVWIVVSAMFATLVWAVAGRRDDRWLLDIGPDRLTVRPHGSLARAGAEDWDSLARLARELGVGTIVVDLPEPQLDELSQWALRRAQQRVGTVASVTLAA